MQYAYRLNLRLLTNIKDIKGPAYLYRARGQRMSGVNGELKSSCWHVGKCTAMTGKRNPSELWKKPENESRTDESVGCCRREASTPRDS